MKVQKFKDIMEDIIIRITDLIEENIPRKGDVSNDCQKTTLIIATNALEHAVDGTTQEDMEA